MELGQAIWRDVNRINKQNPLIHNITNYVVMNNTANALLALGASPVMAHAIEEITEMIASADALVLNIGTLDNQWISSMYGALNAAEADNTPVIFDPVGAGATKLRTQTTIHLINKCYPNIICGNGSEIKAIAGAGNKTRGVDSLDSSGDAIEAAEIIAERYNTVVVISGEYDYVIDSDNKIKLKNGHEMMGVITGMGCTATAISAAFAGVNDSYFDAAVHGVSFLGIAGEIAAEYSAGPGSLQVNILDEIYNLNEKQIEEKVKFEKI